MPEKEKVAHNQTMVEGDDLAHVQDVCTMTLKHSSQQ